MYNYSDRIRPGSASIFVGGFVLGGLIFGTLNCVYAPQVRCFFICKNFPVILLDIRGFGVLLRGEGWAERLLGIGKGVGEEEDTKIFIYFWRGKIIFK